jgi:phosphatidylinositol glycan class A protein
VTIVVLSRLMYRKGIDLLIATIPRICERHPDVHFVIGGDGPKRVELEQMREKHLLHQRVELCGAIRQGDARDVSSDSASAAMMIAQIMPQYVY